MESTDSIGIGNTIQRIVGTPDEKISEKTDPAVEMFVKAKLTEWDKDQSGHFSRDEVKTGMEELRDTLAQLASLKWTLIKGSIVLALGILFMLCASGVAMILAKQTTVSDNGRMEDVGTNEVVVTALSEENGYVESMLNFDSVNDEWEITDAALRDMLTIGFTGVNGTFHFMNIADITRFDSQFQNRDKLEVTTTAGHLLRYYEVIAQLEVKWQGTNLWEIVERSEGPSGILRSLSEEGEEGEEEWDDVNEVDWPDGAQEPPTRRILKGGGGFGAYGGGTAARGRSGGTYAASSAGGTSGGAYGHHTHTGVYVGGTYFAWHAHRSSGSPANRTWYERRSGGAPRVSAEPSAAALAFLAAALAANARLVLAA